MNTLKRYCLLLIVMGLIVSPAAFGRLQPAVAQTGTFVNSGQKLGGGFALNVTLGRPGCFHC